MNVVEYSLDPVPFFMSDMRLADQVHRIHPMLVDSLRHYQFDRITPLIRQVFGDESIGTEDSGVNELYPPPKRDDLPNGAEKRVNLLTSELILVRNFLASSTHSYASDR
jgi:hypothetical protein